MNTDFIPTPGYIPSDYPKIDVGAPQIGSQPGDGTNFGAGWDRVPRPGGGDMWQAPIAPMQPGGVQTPQFHIGVQPHNQQAVGNFQPWLVDQYQSSLQNAMSRLRTPINWNPGTPQPQQPQQNTGAQAFNQFMGALPGLMQQSQPAARQNPVLAMMANGSGMFGQQRRSVLDTPPTFRDARFEYLNPQARGY